MKTSSIAALLRAQTGITSLLGAPVTPPGQTKPSAAVYQDALPRRYNLGAILVHRYNGVREQDMTGPIDQAEDNIQLDIYGGTPSERDAITDACRSFLVGFTGQTPDGTVITGTYLEQDRDMPYLANASQDAEAFRALLGFRVVSKV